MTKSLSPRSMQCSALTAITCLVLGAICTIPLPANAQPDDPSAPIEPVRLIFIHHSCGENWLADGHGGLGRALGQNNYYVSDTNYGWGPGSIGDRTDITDWPEWFTGSDSGRYLSALYAESGQLSPYTRTLPDPGGENQIILFKSCFPNSNLEGNPNDPPARGGGLTVGNAKAIYNELLTYFATHPDKLFVAITAPPVQDPAHARNARAFNTWLVTEWLGGYGGSNVAVFDFYNVLTHPDNHHRFRDGGIEYVTDRGGDTLYYPTNGDDHPSTAGNRKATEEFVPVLNVYYHRWTSGVQAPPQPAAPTSEGESPTPESPPPVEQETAAPEHPPLPAPVGGVIDDFESDASNWAVFVDTEKETSLTCARDAANAYSGTSGLRIEYDVAPDSWATCSLVHPSPQDWRDGQGLTVYLRAEQAGQEVVIVAYQGASSDDLLHFEFRAQAHQDAVDGWQRVDIPWDQFLQPPWQGDASVPFNPGQAMGVAFAFDAPTGDRESGKLWVDDVGFLSAVPPSTSATQSPATATEGPSAGQPEEEGEEESGRGGVCPGSAALGLAASVAVVWVRRQSTSPGNRR